MTWSTEKHLKELLPKRFTIVANARIRVLSTGTEHVALNVGFKVNHLIEEKGKKRNKPHFFPIASLGYNIAWARAVLKHRELYGITDNLEPDQPVEKQLVINTLKMNAVSNGIEIDPLKIASIFR